MHCYVKTKLGPFHCNVCQPLHHDSGWLITKFGPLRVSNKVRCVDKNIVTLTVFQGVKVLDSHLCFLNNAPTADTTWNRNDSRAV